MKIGFIGLGIMGSRMAARLQTQGHPLVIYNRSPDKAQTLLTQGALWAAQPAEVGVQADVIFTMLANPEAVHACALGEHGFLNTLAAGSLWVDCSTVNPMFTREMAAAAQARGIRFMDAPVTGSKLQAENGELAFLVGGQPTDLEQVNPLFEVMGRRVLYVGEVGMGMALKLVVNMLLGTSMAAFAEAMAFGQALNIPQATLLNVLIGGPVVPPFMVGKQPKITSGTYEADFPLQWMVKDLQMVALAAYDTGTVSLLTDAAKALFGLAMNAGYGDQDFSAIYAYTHQKPTSSV